MMRLSKTAKMSISLILACIFVWLLWYFYLAHHMLYAVVSDSEGKAKWTPVYRSMCFDRAHNEYMYMNTHREAGVDGYILVDTEEGNSIIPF